MFSFIDVAGESIDDFFILATKGNPGDWSGIFRCRSGICSLLRAFPGEWLVSLDANGRDVAVVSDDGILYRYFDGKWEKTDTRAIHGLINVKIRGDGSIFVTGANGFLAQFRGESVQKYSLGCRNRIMGLSDKAGDLFLVGDKGLFMVVRDNEVSSRTVISDEMLCDVSFSNGVTVVVGARGRILWKYGSSSWKIVEPPKQWDFTEVCHYENNVFFGIGGGIMRIENAVSKVEVFPDPQLFLCALQKTREGKVIGVGENEVIVVGPDWKQLDTSFE